MIAAIALAQDLTLVVPSATALSRVPGLQVEDWKSRIRRPRRHYPVEIVS